VNLGNIDVDGDFTILEAVLLPVQQSATISDDYNPTAWNQVLGWRMSYAKYLFLEAVHFPG
jgi:hypothetical protein